MHAIAGRYGDDVEMTAQPVTKYAEAKRDNLAYDWGVRITNHSAFTP